MKIGVVEKKANVLTSGDLTVYGSAYFKDGVEGALTLPSGAPTVRSGNNVTIANNTDGSIVINAEADTSSLTEEFAQVPGLVDSLSAQVSSLAATVSSFASSLGSITNNVTTLQSSVTNLQSTTNLIAGNVTTLNTFITSTSSSLDTRVTEVSSSLSNSVTALSSSLSGSVSAISGSLTSLSGSLSALELKVSNLKGGLGVGLAMNEQVAGVRDGVNKTFSLSHVPSPPSSLMLFLNGQLLAGGNGSDFLSIGDEVVLSEFIPAPNLDDVILAMYSYEVPVKSYSINEPITSLTMGNSGYEIELANVPSPPDSLMLFMNGQLLTAGETNDYILSGKNVVLAVSLVDIQESRFFATYSY